jgi:hypothetical protein
MTTKDHTRAKEVFSTVKKHWTKPLSKAMSIWQFPYKERAVSTARQWYRRIAVNHASEIFELFGELRQADSVLQQASKRLETQFLSTSTDLEKLKNSGDQFIQQVETLVGIATGKDCDSLVFTASIQLIEETTVYLTDCQAETERMLETLRDYKAQIGRLLGAEAELQRAMLPLKCVQTLFKVESAALDETYQHMFGALTQEIELLHGQVREIFGTKFKQLEKTRLTLGLVIGRLEEQSRVMRGVMQAHHAQIEASLASLKKELTSNKDRDLSLQRLSKMMGREVDQIVMGLQSQDIINQKLQHVVEALPKIHGRFAEQAKGNRAAEVERFQILRQSCRVEAGQLAAVQKELSAAEQSIRQGIEKVLSYMREVDSECLSLKEFKKLTTSCDGTVQMLVEILEEVRELVGATVVKASEAHEALRPMGSLTSDLTANVRGMSHRIHLIGLNARIQAAHAAEVHARSGLEVLSAQTNDISNETSRISEQAATRLDELAAGLAQIVKAFEQLHAKGLEQKGILDNQGRTEEGRLHALRDSALETVNAIGQSLENIRDQATACLSGVNFNEFLEVTIPSLQQPLSHVADKAEDWLRTRRQDIDQVNRIDHFQRDYTMASEHAVFHEVIRGGNALEAPAAPAESSRLPMPEQTTAASGLGNNVELF